MGELDSPFQYNFDALEAFSFSTVIAQTVDEEKAIAWCMQVGLLDKTRRCSLCECEMRLTVASKRWRCTRRALHADRSEIQRGVLVGSFFEDAKLPVNTLVRLLLCWCMRLSHPKAMEVSGACAESVSDWYAYCRSKCSDELVSIDCAIGGEGHVVEIDETSLAKKRKYNRGRFYQDYWLFGGVDRTTGRWFGRVVYNKRTKSTLIPIIKDFIKSKTRIVSDMFATYVCERAGKVHHLANNRVLSRMEYTHDWVNHSLHFKDPVTGAHTNTIEGLWEIRIKRHIKSMRGMTRENLDSYLDEYMSRSWFFPARCPAAKYLCGLVQAIRRHQ